MEADDQSAILGVGHNLLRVEFELAGDNGGLRAELPGYGAELLFSVVGAERPAAPNQ